MKTVEELQKELEAERALKNQAAEELAKTQAENELLKAKSDATVLSPVTVAGEVTLETVVEGKKVKKTYTISDGHKRTWSPNGNLVPTEKLVDLANGKTLSKEDLELYPHLAEFVDGATLESNGSAKKLLTSFAQSGAAILVEKK